MTSAQPRPDLLGPFGSVSSTAGEIIAVVERALREQIAQEIETVRRKDRYVWDSEYKNGLHDGIDDGLAAAAAIARGIR